MGRGRRRCGGLLGQIEDAVHGDPLTSQHGPGRMLSDLYPLLREMDGNVVVNLPRPGAANGEVARCRRPILQDRGSGRVVFGVDHVISGQPVHVPRRDCAVGGMRRLVAVQRWTVAIERLRQVVERRLASVMRPPARAAADDQPEAASAGIGHRRHWPCNGVLRGRLSQGELGTVLASEETGYCVLFPLAIPRYWSYGWEVGCVTDVGLIQMGHESSEQKLPS